MSTEIHVITAMFVITVMHVIPLISVIHAINVIHVTLKHHRRKINICFRSDYCINLSFVQNALQLLSLNGTCPNSKCYKRKCTILMLMILPFCRLY